MHGCTGSNKADLSCVWFVDNDRRGDGDRVRGCFLLPSSWTFLDEDDGERTRATSGDVGSLRRLTDEETALVRVFSS